MNLFCFGLGYTALHFVRSERARFGRVAGTVRTTDKAKQLAAEDIVARIWPGDGAIVAAEIATSDAMLVSVSPGEGGSRGDPVLDAFADAITAAPNLGWIGYLSTIGVYGDHGGAWIDEATAPNEPDARARARLAAEAAWLALGARAGKPVDVFRLAGIYGPGRNALAQLAAGTARPIVKPGQVFNRIHVADIAAALATAMAHPRPGEVVNVADDEPAPQPDVIAYAAGLLGREQPPMVPFTQAALSPMAASFWAENRRVRNTRLKERLGLALRYPSYREGLRALREAGEGMSGQSAIGGR